MRDGGMALAEGQMQRRKTTAGEVFSSRILPICKTKNGGWSFYAWWIGW